MRLELFGAGVVLYCDNSPSNPVCLPSQLAFPTRSLARFSLLAISGMSHCFTCHGTPKCVSIDAGAWPRFSARRGSGTLSAGCLPSLDDGNLSFMINTPLNFTPSSHFSRKSSGYLPCSKESSQSVSTQALLAAGMCRPSNGQANCSANLLISGQLSTPPALNIQLVFPRVKCPLICLPRLQLLVWQRLFAHRVQLLLRPFTTSLRPLSVHNRGGRRSTFSITVFLSLASALGRFFI